MLDLASDLAILVDIANGPSGEGYLIAMGLGSIKKGLKKKLTSNQVKRLTKHEINKLKKNGFDIHDLKGSKGASKRDLFKDKDGNIEIRPKDGYGPGEPTGINVNDL